MRRLVDETHLRFAPSERQRRSKLGLPTGIREADGAVCPRRRSLHREGWPRTVFRALARRTVVAERSRFELGLPSETSIGVMVMRV